MWSRLNFGIRGGYCLSPKEYLSQIKLMDIKISQRIQELNSIKKSYLPPMQKEKVQYSTLTDVIGRKMVKIEDIEFEINKNINELLETKHRIIGEIHSLNNSLYIEILFKRYVEFKSLRQIASEMNYSFIHIRRSHGYALLEFKMKVLKDDTH